jgi:hypothetical protein
MLRRIQPALRFFDRTEKACGLPEQPGESQDFVGFIRRQLTAQFTPMNRSPSQPEITCEPIHGEFELVSEGLKLRKMQPLPDDGDQCGDSTLEAPFSGGSEVLTNEPFR